MRNQLTTLLEAIRDAQGVLRSQTHSAIAAEMLRAILCNSRVCAAMHACDETSADHSDAFPGLRDHAHLGGLPL